MMLRRTCQCLTARLSQIQLVSGCGPVSTIATAPLRANRGKKKMSKKATLLSEAWAQEKDNPGYLEELSDTQELMTVAHSSSSFASSLRIQMRASHRAAVRRRVSAAKFAKLLPPELNLLTWSAKRQLMELAVNEPDLWTPEALSDVFPVSVRQAERLVKWARAREGQNLVKRDPVAIYRHDRAVLQRLRQLEATQRDVKGRPKVDAVQPGFEWLVRSDKWHLLSHANGNPVLPLSQKHVIEDALEEEARRPVGPFEALLNGPGVERPRQSRLDAFIALCERQNAALSSATNFFSVDETRKTLQEAGLVARPSKDPQPPAIAAQQPVTMFAAAAVAPEPLQLDSADVAPEKVEETPTTFASLVEHLEADPAGLPRSNSKLDRARPPLRFRSRVRMDRVQIFRYSFDTPRDVPE